MLVLTKLYIKFLINVYDIIMIIFKNYFLNQKFVILPLLRRYFKMNFLLCIPDLRAPGSRGRHTYRDRRLTTNFELWVEIFCVPTCFHVRIPKPCLSVCPHPEKSLKRYHIFVNISPTLVFDTSMERSSRVLHHGNPKIWIFFKKVWNSKFVFWRRAEITLASSILVLY